MTIEEYKKWLNENCTKNKEKLKNSNDVCCYYCLKIYKFKEIYEFIDNGETAVCPYCSVDAVSPINLKNLKEELKIIKNANKIGFC